MGFNPTEAIKQVEVPGSPYTFYSILQAMHNKTTSNTYINELIQKYNFSTHSAIINPVVGPEAVAGSSRMKGGSITWILCSSLCHTAIHCYQKQITNPLSIQTLFQRYIEDCEKIVRETYISSNTNNLANIITEVTKSLSIRKSPTIHDTEYIKTTTNEIEHTNQNHSDSDINKHEYVSPTGSGRLLYIGNSTAGLMGLIDASEATDTYGSLFNDIRGFVVDGWEAMGVTMTGTEVNKNNQISYAIDHPIIPLELRGYHNMTNSTSTSTPPMEIANPSLSSFVSSFVPTLSTDDCVVYLHLPQYIHIDYTESNNQILNALQLAKTKHARICSIIIENHSNKPNDKEDLFLQHIKGLCTVNCTVPLSITTFNHDINHHELNHKQHILSSSQSLSSSVRIPSYLGLLSLKLCVNSITTGSHRGRGVIINNRMVNMMLTNHKLYLRSIGIVQSICFQYNTNTIIDYSIARLCILRSIYGDKSTITNYQELQVYKEELKNKINEHDSQIIQQTINLASQTEKVIPTALLLAFYEDYQYTQFKTQYEFYKLLTVEEARNILRKEPRVRIALTLLTK